MRHRRAVTVFAVFVLTCAAPLAAQAPGVFPPPGSCPSGEVYFYPPITDAAGRPLLTPKQGIIKQIRAATRRIWVEVYEITDTNMEIPNELIARASGPNRVPDIQVLLNAYGTVKNENLDMAPLFKKAGITVYLDEAPTNPLTRKRVHTEGHNKIALFDADGVLTGSMNWTNGSFDNAENLVFIRDRTLVSYYERNWQEHLQHSTRY